MEELNVAFALVTGKMVHFTPNYKIQMCIKHKGEIVEGSLGEDTFTHNGMLFSETPISATGRAVEHAAGFDLAAYTGIPGVPVILQADDLEDMSLWIVSNFILDQGELQTYYRLQITVDGREIPQTLHSPLTPVEWVGRGEFCIHGLDTLICL